ncbi:MAG: aminopeptidase N [Gammaproteobacteria bacterium]|nr:aminopeptidase N [Gammaproteobacteria bacterium]MDH5651580.1 aminopeptidase N [Gammaproteobacteria bacterium]
MADITNEPAAAPGAIYLKDYLPPAYLVDEAAFEFDLDADTTEVRSALSLRRNPDYPHHPAPLVLYGNELETVSVRLDGTELSAGQYQIQGEELTVSQVPEQFSLNITTRIHPGANTALEGVYHSGKMLCTQCEAEGFRRITWFPDRPDVMSTYTVTLAADKKIYPVLLSNGNLIDQGELDNGRHFAKWHDPSLKPSYLFAVVAGQLRYHEDTFTTMHGRVVTLRVYVEEENYHKCEHAMLSLKQSMQWDEETYGREYDLDIFMIVAVNDFNMGAMENKGLNIFNASCVLASPDTATDHDYYNIQSIIGHEYFHNWSGNRVTCRDWFQLSLKEGFTVFRDQEFSSDLNSRPVQRIDDVDVLRNHQFPQDAGPMAHPVRPDHYIEISNFYTVTVYNKGAEVVRMQRNLLGAEGFRKGTDLYFSRHDGQAVTTDDFVKAMEDSNNIDLSQFKRWYSQAGTPQLAITDRYDAATKLYTLHVEQVCPPTPGQEKKLPFHIPLAVGLLDEQGNDLPLQLQGESRPGASTRVLEVRDAAQDFVFENIPAKPVPSLLRDFSAPVHIRMDRRDEELAFLFAHDSNEFNRWEAGQQLAVNIMLGLMDDYRADKVLMIPNLFVDAFRKVLQDKQLDKSLAALALSLPAENYLAEQREEIDVEAIHHVRQFMRRELALALREEFYQVYQDNRSDAAFVFNAQAMGQRALKNIALAYLLETEEAAAIELCVSQFNAAHNMTDVMAALGALVHFDIPQRAAALADFYAKWQHDSLVVDKWLALQAGSRLPAVLSHVQSLTQHPAFSIRNPNKVRALIGRFCMGNHHFHAASGAGYTLLADYVLQLDAVNPQIAARLAQGMARWKRYDAKRRDLMQVELQRIFNQTGLSKDVYEVVGKMLGQA